MWWPRCVAVLLISVIVASFMAYTDNARASTPNASAYTANNVIVKIEPTASITDIAALYSLNVAEQLDDLPIYRLRITDGTPPLDMANLLAVNPLVVYAEPNFIGQAPESVQQSAWVKGNDAGQYQKQWAPTTLRLPEAHAVSDGAGVTVAVLDTGADLAHPALAGHLVQGFDFVDLDNDPSEEGTYGQDIAYGHGTHVAGLVTLAAPGAKIMPLRILKPDGTGDSWTLAQAVRYAATQQAHVINLSYSVQQRAALLDDLLGEVATATPGAVVVAAAGNRGSDVQEYPAAEEQAGVLAVAASRKNDKLAAFSNYGSWVGVAAPGENIVSSVPLASGSAYATWSGTSMAAPLTAGTAALVRASMPGLSPAEVVAQIRATAATIKGPVPLRVDAAAAVGR